MHKSTRTLVSVPKGKSESVILNRKDNSASSRSEQLEEYNHLLQQVEKNSFFKSSKTPSPQISVNELESNEEAMIVNLNKYTTEKNVVETQNSYGIESKDEQSNLEEERW